MFGKIKLAFASFLKAVVYFFAFTAALAFAEKTLPILTTPSALYDFVKLSLRGEPFCPFVNWTSYENISPNFFKCLIAAEDARFFRHRGIDWKAVKSAVRYNEIHKGRKKRGASTITMQTAKNVYLCHCRNYVRKAFEAYFAYLLEAVWGKRRILEVYANVVEFGKGVYGAEKASRKFFGKPASKLSLKEAAALVVVLPNPEKRSPLRLTRYLRKRIAFVARRAKFARLPKNVR